MENSEIIRKIRVLNDMMEEYLDNLEMASAGEGGGKGERKKDPKEAR